MSDKEEEAKEVAVFKRNWKLQNLPSTTYIFQGPPSHMSFALTRRESKCETEESYKHTFCPFIKKPVFCDFSDLSQFRLIKDSQVTCICQDDHFRHPTQLKHILTHRNYRILSTKNKVMIKTNTNFKIHGSWWYTICPSPPSHNRVPFNYSANVLFVSQYWTTYGTFTCNYEFCI